MICFHCHENIPKGLTIQATIAGETQLMCCHGCKAVAEFIDESGNCEFYDYRGDSQPASKAQVAEKKWQQFDDTLNFQAFTSHLFDNIYTTTIRLDGIYCSACGWLIDKHLRGLQGIKDVKLNTITKKLLVEFDSEKIKLSQILTTINFLGYQPILSQGNEGSESNERKNALKRLVLAGFGMMFIMTISVPIYSGKYSGIDPQIQRFFELVSLLVATIVYFYSGIIFLKNALRDISNKHLGMDVPVAISISLAYVASVYNVLSHNGQTIYFDSMVMFIFFLLAGRFVEMTVRHQGMNAHDALASMVPTSVSIVKKSGISQAPFSSIVKGDIIQVGSGESIPVDGVVLSGNANINESMITGEEKPITKSNNSTVMAGSKVEDGEIQITSKAIGDETILASLNNLLEKAQLQKPKTLQLVDKLAAWFVAVVLVLATATAIYYQIFQPEKTMLTVLAVLVATCPCALSLATPAALTAASVRLMKSGILINNLDAITKISKIKQWFFDKTGTLTEPQMSLIKVHNYSGFSDNNLLKIIATLEHNSFHPIASAFDDYYDESITLREFKEVASLGVKGVINGLTYKSGSKTFVGFTEENIQSSNFQNDSIQVYLSGQDKLLAIFELDNQLRKGTQTIINQLQKDENHLVIISGDKQKPVEHVAKILRIKDYYAEQTPEEKINIIHQQQADSNGTVMLGDGVNDAPVLAQSDVSISFNQGTQLARAASDLIIMGNSLTSINSLLKISRKTNNIIKQNIIWALLYNLCVTPLAMMGYLAPWMAAIGMSLSSLFVVLNAKRILLK